MSGPDEHPHPSAPQPRRVFGRGFGPQGWIAVGLGLRALLLVLAGETVLVADEANYFYLALAWERFGFLLDTERYLWPPLYPLLVRALLGAFGPAGEQALHGLQVLLSAAIGWGTVRLAGASLGRRAAHWAGALWALHLPLAAYTHLTWPETLFLALLVPAVVLLVEGAAASSPGLERRLVLAGLLLGAAALVKEVALGLVPVLALAIALGPGRHGPLERLRRGLLPLLFAGLVVAPWSLRNGWVYGSPAPAGITLGENAFHGLNARYVNFDHRLVGRVHEQGGRVQGSVRGAFVLDDPGRAWERSNHTNTARRSAENVRRGLAWVAANPWDFARTRVKKLADLVAPQSFVVRHLALDAYGGPLGRPPLRRVLVVWALAAHVALFVLGILGLPRLVRDPRAGRVLGATLVYFLAVGLLVAMSRFHLPLVPFLAVSASGFLAAPARAASRGEWITRAVLLGALFLLWWIDYPEVLEMVRLAWR